MQAMRGDFYIKHGIHTAYAVLLFNLFRISTKSHLDPIKKRSTFLKSYQWRSQMLQNSYIDSSPSN